MPLLYTFNVLYPPPARPGDGHADSVVVVGITVACAILVFLITLMVTSCYFIVKNGAVQKDVPVTVPSF